MPRSRSDCPPCAIPECGKARRTPASVWCSMHSERFRVHGTTDKPVPFEKRLWAKVNKRGPGGCWLWTATVNHAGYGRFCIGGRGNTGLAHRVVYEFLVGPVPEGLQLDHSCNVRRCVNPKHLEPVTAAENWRRRDERNAAA